MSISLTHTKTSSSTPAAVSKTSIEPYTSDGSEQQNHQNSESLTITWTIRQDPLTVTLDGRAIFALTTGLLLVLHCLPRLAVAFLVAAVPLALAIRNDFLNYLRLGPGGTPPTVAGYLRISWYKLWALRTPFTPLDPEPGVALEPATGLFRKQGRPDLPLRRGPRPTVVGIAPQRQTDQFGSRACYVALRQILTQHAAKPEHSDLLDVGTSCFEKHGLALFARTTVNETCRGEICHVHDSDHSLHLNLHPDDAREVLEKGWGQRHPLTAPAPGRFFAWCSGLLFGIPRRMPVPRHFTMVYAPRTAEELRVVCRIIQAAGWWVMARDLEMDILGEDGNEKEGKGE